MAQFEAVTPDQFVSILSSYVVPAIPTKEQAAARDYAMAEKLDKRADEYRAAGNEKMANICSAKALAACIRADVALGRC